MTDNDTTFHCMGSEVRLLIGPPSAPGLASEHEAAADARSWL